MTDKLIEQLKNADTRVEYRTILYEYNMEHEREDVEEAISKQLSDDIELKFK